MNFWKAIRAQWPETGFIIFDTFNESSSISLRSLKSENQNWVGYPNGDFEVVVLGVKAKNEGANTAVIMNRLKKTNLVRIKTVEM